MKKLLLKFADQVLSREELRNVKGGDGPYGNGIGCGGCFVGNSLYPCNSVGPNGCLCPYTGGSACSKG